MKKLITLLALAAVAIAPLFAGMRAPARNDVKAPLAKLDNNTSRSAGFAATLDANVFDQSTNGYGWYNNHNSKIAYDVQSGIYGTIYRQKDASGSGALGGMVGTWGSNSAGNLYQQTPSDAGARYPHVTAKYGYVWGVWGDYISGGGAVSDPYITIYSTADEDWSDNMKMVDEGGASAPGTWMSHGDVTKKPDGTYVFTTAWEVDGLNSGNVAMITGTTTDPMDASAWTFSDYQDTYMKKGEGVVGSNNPKFAWGVDGFGVAITTADIDGTGVYNVSYIFTKDYGETWEMGEQNGFPSYKQVSMPTLFPNIWQQPVAGSTISGVNVNYDFDVTVDENNMVHFISNVSADDGTNSYAFTDAGTPINGWWDMHGTLNGAGDDLNWNPVFIAQQYGWLNQTEVEQFNGAGATMFRYGRTSVGYAGNGVIYAGWLDRPENLADLVASPYAANDIYHLILDGYVSMSPDNGNTWYHGVEATGTLLAKGFNVTNTQPEAGDTFGVNSMEEGWCVSDHGLNDHSGAVTFYAVNQYADKDNHYDDPADYYDHEQFLRIWKIDASDVGIKAEQTSLTKDFALEQNYPNPFNPTTAISFKLQSESKVNLAIFNANGEKVANLINGKMGIGSHSVDFNASNLNSGVYFYSLSVNNRTETKKMVLTK